MCQSFCLSCVRVSVSHVSEFLSLTCQSFCLSCVRVSKSRVKYHVVYSHIHVDATTPPIIVGGVDNDGRAMAAIGLILLLLVKNA